MVATKMADKNSNRRVAFRAYERANLSYHKIDDRQSIAWEPGFAETLTAIAGTPDESTLPASQSQENDTLNVNISTSGIAFTCEESLRAGDYLLLRILLLSRMTEITTCCKVVYCKPSNPYETDRYPFAIGAQFVNLTAEDSALINEHVQKSRRQRWVGNGLMAMLVTAVLAMPEQALALLEAMLHHLLEIVLHLLHLGFEYLEMGLDHVVEHNFHTDTHETQVIVFYTIVCMGLTALFFLWRLLPPAYRRLRDWILLSLLRKKASVLYFWNQQSTTDKMKYGGLALLAVTSYFYLLV